MVPDDDDDDDDGRWWWKSDGPLTWCPRNPGPGPWAWQRLIPAAMLKTAAAAAAAAGLVTAGWLVVPVVRPVGRRKRRPTAGAPRQKEGLKRLDKVSPMAAKAWLARLG